MADSNENSTELSSRSALSVAELSSLPSMISYFGECIKATTYVCKPAAVVSYDRGTKRAKVVPLVRYAYPSGNGGVSYVTEAEFTVPIRFVCSGGFTIDVPVFPGDTGWLIASDVDTSILRQTGNATSIVREQEESVETVQSYMPTNPGSFVRHDFANGFFIPDCWGAFRADAIKSGNATVGDGALYIGESREGTCSVDNTGKSSVKTIMDGLVSISMSRGESNGKGSMRMSVGSKCTISIDGSTEDIRLSVGGSCDFRITKEKVTVEAPSVELPNNTTIGGRSFSNNAFA